MTKFKLPGSKVANDSKEFAMLVTGNYEVESIYYFDTDEIEIEGVDDRNKVLDAYDKFEHDPLWGRPEHHRRAAELLDKDELTDEEEHELKKLERQVLKEQLRGRQ